MCVISMISDEFRKRWEPWKPATTPGFILPVDAPSRQEFQALKREVELLRDLLVRAKEYDKATGQPDCEQEEKLDLLRKIAKLVGVELPV